MTESPSGPPAAGPLPRRRLGDQLVSNVGLGAMQLPRLRNEPGAAVALLRRAVELGVSHVDTAQFYGDGLANQYLAEALRADDGVMIVSKVGAAPQRHGPVPMRAAQRPDELRDAVHANLRSLRLEQIPLVNLRRIDPGGRFPLPRNQVVDFDAQLAEIVALRDEGLIGLIGLSTVTLDQLNRALPVGIACVQNPYSLASRDGEELLDVCVRHDIAWVPYFPLGGAWPGAVKVTSLPVVQEVAHSLGSTPAQVGLAWLLHRAPNVLLIPGTASIAHLEENVAAGRLILDDATRAAMDDAAPPRGIRGLVSRLRHP